MTSSVITVSPETVMAEIVSCMEQNYISTVVVVRNNLPVGIFTERNLLRIKTTGAFDFSMPVQEVMTTRLVVVREHLESREAYQVLLQHNIRHLIVVDNKGLLAGIVTETNLFHHLGLEFFVAFEEINTIMSPNVIALAEDNSVLSAMQLMNNHNISSVVIIKRNVPTGIITERDIVRLTGADINVSTTPLHEVMTSPVQSVAFNKPSHAAADLMKSKGIRRLVVTDEKGRLGGIVTTTDMIKGFKSDYTALLKEVIEKQAEELQEVHRQLDEKIILESIMHSTTDIAFAVADLHYRIIHYNKAAEKIFGYATEEVLNKTIPEICEQEGLDYDLYKNINKTIKQEGKFHSIHKIAHGDRTLHVEANIFAIRNNNNKIQGFVLIAKEITELIRTGEHLKQRGTELEETNAALRVLLKQRDEDKKRLEHKLQSNIDQLVLPLFSKLRNTTIDPAQDNIINSIEANLLEVSSPFAHQLSSLYTKLTPAEIQVANLIKNGHSSKEIAAWLNLSVGTVYTHRRNIRKKSNITNKKVNLQSILTQLQ